MKLRTLFAGIPRSAVIFASHRSHAIAEVLDIIEAVYFSINNTPNFYLQPTEKNRFTREFAERFCDTTGRIMWSEVLSWHMELTRKAVAS